MLKSFGKPAVGALVGLFVLSACGSVSSSKNRTYFDGLYFPATVKSVDKKRQRETFTVTLKKVSQSRKAAGEAGHFEGTRYCVEQYGTTVIDWVENPLDVAAEMIPVDDRFTFQGTCRP